MNMEFMEPKLLREICGVIFIISIVLYDSFSRYQNLGKAKNVDTRGLSLMYYLTYVLTWLYISFGLAKIQKYFTAAWLTAKKNKQFTNLLGGQSIVHMNDFERQFELPTLFLMKFNGTSKEFCKTMKRHIHNALYQKLDENQTVCGNIKYFKGFYHIIRDRSVHLHLYIKEFEVENHHEPSENEDPPAITKLQLLNYIAEQLKDPLRINDHPLWKIYIGKQSVKWNAKDETVYYSVIFKFSHCLLDRASFMKLILGTFADIKDLNLLFPTVQEINYSKINIIRQYLPSDIFYKLYCFYESIPTILVNYSLFKRKNPGLAIKNDCNDIYLYTIDLGENFVEKVNAIKKKFQNATEFSIIEAAVTASLTKYCRRNSGNIPVDIVCMSVENEECSHLSNATPESLKFENIAFESNIGFTLLNISTPQNADVNVNEILDQNNKQKNLNSRNIQETEITRALFNENYCQFPNNLKHLMCSDKSISTLISNCPGPASTISMNMVSVENIITWSPHILGAAVSFAFCSYRGSYHLTMNINKSLISNRDSADGIITNIKKSLNALSEE